MVGYGNRNRGFFKLLLHDNVTATLTYFNKTVASQNGTNFLA